MSLSDKEKLDIAFEAIDFYIKMKEDNTRSIQGVWDGIQEAQKKLKSAHTILTKEATIKPVRRRSGFTVRE